MAAKFPVRYNFSPKSIEAGKSWVDVTLKNLSQDALTGINVRLNSIDTYAIEPPEDATFISSLAPDESDELHYQVRVRESGAVYVSMDGKWGGEPFHWESPSRRIAVGGEIAELVSVFALTEPHPRPGEPIAIEATLRSLKTSGGLILEFWVETPGGESVSVDKTATDPLAPGDIGRIRLCQTRRESVGSTAMSLTTRDA